MTAVHTGTFRVVIADDSAALRALLSAHIDGDPRFTVAGHAGDGEGAVDVALATDADGVLLDLSMPGTDGLHALRRLQQEAPHIATVVLTGFRAGEFAGESLEVGASAYIEKGVEPRDIADILAAACGGHRSHGTIVSPQTAERVAPMPPTASAQPPGRQDVDPAPAARVRHSWQLWALHALLVGVTASGLAWTQGTNADLITAAHAEDVAEAATLAGVHVEGLWESLEAAAAVVLPPDSGDDQLLGLAAALHADTALALAADGTVAIAPQSPDLVGTTLDDRYAHITALTEGERVASDLVVTPSGRRIASIGVPLPDGRAVSIGFDVDGGLADELFVGLPDGIVRAWIVDGAGRVLADRALELAPEEQLQPPPTVADAARGASTPGWTTTVEPIADTDWSLITSTPDTRVLADVAGLVTALPWLLIALVTTAGAVAVAAADRSRRALDELRRANRELATSNDDLEQFAYVASHDLQEPLRKVASYCQLLERRYADQLDDNARVYIGYAVDGATRMQSLLGDLLRFSRAARADRTTSEVVDLGRATERAIEALSLRVEETGAMIVLSEDPPSILADRTQVQQVVQNLVANALKFCHPDRPPSVRVRAVSDGGMVELSVEDDGIGISPEHHERVFGLFQRLHPRDVYEGTGVGLAICRRMVERAGGRLWVTSTPGEGSTFHATFPAAAKPSHAGERTLS